MSAIDELRAKAMCGLDGIDRVPLADAEAALAECEREKERIAACNTTGDATLIEVQRKLAAITKAAELEDWQHATSCDRYEYHKRDCTCGLAELRAALTEAGEQEKK